MSSGRRSRRTESISIQQQSRGVVGVVSTGTGNIASVIRAAQLASLKTTLITTPEDLDGVDGLILPGVGAFGTAMQALNRSGLSSAIVDWAAQDRPLMGICLGMQLLFSASEEFGACEGLNVFNGRVCALRGRIDSSVKSPHIGWNSLSASRSWDRSLLSHLAPEDAVYFMHSYFVEPSDKRVILSTTRHGDLEFCSAVQQENIFGCQFHPERSGPAGLGAYQQFAMAIHRHKTKEGKDVHALCHA